MIVFVNGPFGVGKSSVVETLARDLRDALVIDPEPLGHLLWSQLPRELRTEEFELEPVWPALTRCVIEETARAYGRPVLVPMTVARPAVFEQIVGTLRHRGFLVHHVTLLADAETIRQRLRHRMRDRGETADHWGELSWEGLQVERCLEALVSPLFSAHIDTAYRSVRSVADEILALTTTRGGAPRIATRADAGERVGAQGSATTRSLSRDGQQGSDALSAQRQQQRG